MRVFTTVLLGGLAGAAFGQHLAGLDRTERPIFLGESPAERKATPAKGFSLSAMPYYSYVSGMGTIVSGPGGRLFLVPGAGGFGRSTFTYRYDTVVEAGAGHQIRDLFVVNVQLSPDSWPVTLTGNYTNDNFRNASRFTGYGITASKPFGFATGQTLELAVTGTQERLSFPSVGGGGGGQQRPILLGTGPITEGMVWDASAGLFFDGGASLVFDYVFKSDFEGAAAWWAQFAAPLGKNLRGRFLVGQHNITGVQFGWKF